MLSRSVARIFLMGIGAIAGAARAAGGHFDVDDATMLDAGRCQYETWFARAPAVDATVGHFGPACRVGPLEIGFNLDSLRTADEHRTIAGPQLKVVADPLIDKFSAGLVWGVSFDVAHGGRPWHTLYAPLTWAAGEALKVHLNAGADWLPHRPRTRRIGLAAEWSVSDSLMLIGERAALFGEWTSRLGLRYSINETISVDLSSARTGPNAVRSYVIGLNHEFAR